MAALDPMPLPPELAGPPPLDPHLLDAALTAVREVAAESAIDMESAVDVLANMLPPEGHTPWAIEDDGAAEWAMRHAAEARAELDALAARTADWVERIQQWFVQAAKGPEATLAFMAHHLEDYALRQRAATHGKRKTVTLPSGQVATRARLAQAVVADEPAVLAWVKTLDPEALAEPVVKEKVLLTGLREVVDVVAAPAEVVLSCGCIIMPPTPDTRTEVDGWALGAAVVCPSCGKDSLVGRVRHVAWLAFAPGGRLRVPGVEVEAPTITASVKPAQP